MDIWIGSILVITNDAPMFVYKGYICSQFSWVYTSD